MLMVDIRYFDISKQKKSADIAASRSAKSSDASALRPTKWLAGLGNEVTPIAPDPLIPENPVKEASGRHYISKTMAGELTKSYLHKVGNMAHGYFSQGMPKGFSIPRNIELGLLDDMPHLGWCRFTAVRFVRPDGKPCLIRVYYANFVASLDTSPEKKFFQLKDIKRGMMFFGVAVSPVGPDLKQFAIDRSVHHGGISFATDSKEKALAAVVKLRTGVDLEEWLSLNERIPSIFDNGPKLIPRTKPASVRPSP